MPITPGRSSLRTIEHVTSPAARRRVWSSTMHDARLAAQADERAGERVVAAAERDEVDVVRRGGGRRLAHLDAALRGELRGVDVRDRLVADAAEERPSAADSVRMRVS